MKDNLTKGERRENKRNKKQYGHKVENRSIFLLDEIIKKKGSEVKKKKNDRKSNKRKAYRYNFDGEQC